MHAKFSADLYAEKISKSAGVRQESEKVHKYRCAFLTFEEVNQLIELVKETVIEIPVILIAVYGMCRSECLSLKWSDINFESMQFTISSSLLQHPGGDYERAATKNESSYRTLPLTRQVKNIPEKQHQTQEENKKLFRGEYHQSDYICTWADGRIITPNYLIF